MYTIIKHIYIIHEIFKKWQSLFNIICKLHIFLKIYETNYFRSFEIEETRKLVIMGEG